MKRLLLVPLLFAACACTSQLPGAPLPAPDAQVGLAALEPCELLTPERLTQLDLQAEGAFSQVEQQGTCSWLGVNDRDNLNVGVVRTISLREYMTPFVSRETLRLGGLDWQVFDSTSIEGVCDLAVEFPEGGFVRIGSRDLGDATKACDLAKAAAPLVAENLPGGEPAPPPPSVAPSPLGDLDPCTMLTSAEASQIGLRPESAKRFEKTGLLPLNCQWSPVDESGGHEDILVLLGSDKSLDDAHFGEQPDRTETLGGREWKVYETPADISGMCRLGLELGPKSYAAISSSNFAAEDKACEQALAAAPLVSAKLPAA